MAQIVKILPLAFRDRYRKYWYRAKSLTDFPALNRIRLKLSKPVLPMSADGAINLHLGCGNIDHPDFVNIDLVPHPHVHYRRPIDDLSIFADCSVDLIYASHCLEHFSFRRVPAVLKEWFRVLRNGGILRLSVPDFDLAVQTYLASDSNLDPIHQVIVGGQDYKYNFHYALFNRKYLTELLKNVGFADVKRWIPGSSKLTTFDDWSNRTLKVGDDEFPISLNLEAKKIRF